MHPWFFGWWFGWIFFALLFALVALKLLFFWRRPWGWGRWHEGELDATAILKRRLASGQITEAEYQSLREILSK